MENDKVDRSIWYLVLAIFIQILECGAAIFLAHVVFGNLRGWLSYESSWALATVVGTLVWAYLLFRTSQFEMFFIVVKPNFGVVLGSALKKDKLEKNIDDRTEIKQLWSQREISQGLHGKLPWETIVGQPVDMRSEILIGTEANKPLIVYTEQGESIELELKWQITLTPLRGSLSNLLRHTEENIIAYFRGRVDAFFMSWVKQRKEKDVADKAELEQDFANLFGGENTTDPDERKYGVWTNKPQLIGIERSKSFQQSAESLTIGKNIGKAIAALSEGFGERAKDVDPNLLLMAGLAASGKSEGLNPIILTGLQGVPHEALAGMMSEINRAKGGKK